VVRLRVASHSIKKDLALLTVGVAAGLLPWSLDKLGVEMPRYGVVILGAVAIMALAWGLADLTSLGFGERFRSRSVSVINAAFLLLVSIALSWWVFRAVPEEARLVPTPTSVRLQFNGPASYPNIVEIKNIARVTDIYYDLRSREDGSLQHRVWFVFVAIDRGIPVKEVLINGNGRNLPRYEVKDLSARSAVIYFDDDIANTVVTIDFRN
jgi:hypothetical protein